MLRRLCAAIDGDLRLGEMLKIQSRHLTFDVDVTPASGTIIRGIKIMLPASNTKGRKTTGKDEAVGIMTSRLVTLLE